MLEEPFADFQFPSRVLYVIIRGATIQLLEYRYVLQYLADDTICIAMCVKCPLILNRETSQKAPCLIPGFYQVVITQRSTAPTKAKDSDSFQVSASISGFTEAAMLLLLFGKY